MKGLVQEEEKCCLEYIFSYKSLQSCTNMFRKAQIIPFSEDEDNK